ncbi:MAG: hypothetical protein IJ716_06250 [Lachnospiraceae bacterium]|nr:hypothetical protein [Lachnospiraceae bacterium]
MTFSEKGIPMFLGAMYEREGKRVSDYTGWAEKLEKRYNDLVEEMNDD